MPDTRRAGDRVGRLVAATGRRMYLSTLALIAILVVGIGLATALAALNALDSDVDHALADTVSAALVRLDGELPSTGEQPESDEPPSGSSDTFILEVAPDGTVAANPSRVALAGLPVGAAIAAARSNGRDLRTVVLDGISVRLLTVPIVSTDGSTGGPVGYVQGGFVLTLHDRESRSLTLTIFVGGVIGLAGAAGITLLVTRRALAPIRRAFDAQMRFVADASHELRTPAAIIRATAEVLEREGHIAPAGRPLVADIVAESDRLGGLVGDLLTLATEGSAGLVMDRVAVEAAEIARTAARRAEPLAAERGVTVSVAAGSDRRTVVDGDRDRLVQLVLILLDNAIDHAPPGTTVTIDVDRAGPSVHLSVSDSGPGIPVADRERIFEPFARLDRSDRRSGNAGLGLAIARQIAAVHGGTIVATERPEGGARLVLSLPASASGHAATA
jgi:signal transduction histidine kinase